MIGEVYKIEKGVDIGVELDKNDIIKITGYKRIIDKQGLAFKILKTNKKFLLNMDKFVITKEQLLYIGNKVQYNNIKKVN